MSSATAVERIGTPAVLKTRRLGYDGKGQAVIHDAVLAEDAWRAIGEVPAILERLVAFDRELSILGVRGRDGSVACYPLVENHHRDGILRLVDRARAGSDAPSPGAGRVAARAPSWTGWSTSACMAIELFQMGDELLGNEMAPRVHNSGHWTIEGAETSQFENHLRAVTGLPLGSTEARGSSAMVNLIGAVPDAAAIADVPGAHLHLYGKEPRPGRKLGHVTIVAEGPEELDLDRLKAAGVQIP